MDLIENAMISFQIDRQKRHLYKCLCKSKIQSLGFLFSHQCAYFFDRWRHKQHLIVSVILPLKIIKWHLVCTLMILNLSNGNGIDTICIFFAIE